jgi:Holliday junction resolvasome RuvABC endonuclease subunit
VTTTAPEPTPTTPDRPAGPVVIGLDPSLTGTGIASSNGWCDVIGYKRARAKDPGITQLPHSERITAMRTLLDQILTTIGDPALIVMELPAPSRSGGGAHERGWLWWQLYNHYDQRETLIGLLTPNQRALYATGKGQATKNAVVDAVARRFPAWPTEGDDNAADAVTLMAAGRDWLGWPITDMPKTHRAALDKATWPTLPGADR